MDGIQHVRSVSPYRSWRHSLASAEIPTQYIFGAFFYSQASWLLTCGGSESLGESRPEATGKPEPSTQEVLAGLVERITYHNAENGFCVLRAKARGHRDVVTVVGHAATISAGEWITASGEWVNDRTHGRQFKARFLRTSPPTSADGIEKYLSSGMIRGVGPVYAKKLVRAFGEKVFEVIETTPDRLREIDGIGPVRAADPVWSL